MLVAIHPDVAALAVRDLHGRDLARKGAVLLGAAGPLLRAQREGVLVDPADLVILGHVLGGLGHRIDAVLVLEHRVDEAPADRGVVDLGRALPRPLALAHHEGRAGHRFHPAREREVDVAGPDRPGGGAHRVEAGGAEPVQRHARHALGQPGEQQAHAGDVAVVLARLVGAAEKDFFDALLEGGMAVQERAEGDRREVIGPHCGERTAVAADRRPHEITDEDVPRLAHHRLPDPCRAFENAVRRPV